MRQEATAASNPVLGHVFVSIYYRAFLVGPGFFAGLANGVILGYLMYRSELVPRGMTWLGLIGRPLVMITGILIMYNAIARRRDPKHRDAARGPLGAVAQHLLHREGVQAYFPDPPSGRVTTLPESGSAVRHELRATRSVISLREPRLSGQDFAFGSTASHGDPCWLRQAAWRWRARSDGGQCAGKGGPAGDGSLLPKMTNPQSVSQSAGHRGEWHAGGRVGSLPRTRRRSVHDSRNLPRAPAARFRGY